MNNRGIRNLIVRKAGALLLSLVLAVTMMPFYVFAETLDSDPQQDAEAATEIAVSEEIYTEDEPAAELISDIDLPESEDLLEQYIENKSGTEVPPSPEEQLDSQSARSKARLMARKTVLNESGLKLYEALEEGIQKIADGSTDNSCIDVIMTREEYDQCEYTKVIAALRYDHPYDLYWFDKKTGALRKYDSEAQTAHVYFAVSADYRLPEVVNEIEYTDAEGQKQYFKVYKTDLSKTGAVSSAVDNAMAVVSKYADYSDLGKLYSYRDEICSMTDYNYQAGSADYGDPWQLIYVFDGDPATKVVCEGYAKAFQFLCDATTFANSQIECNSMPGYLGSPTGLPHMWNAVRMDDGKYYLADITHCETYPDQLFLKGFAGGSPQSGYTYLVSGTGDSARYNAYYYDNTARTLYSTEELTMSGSDCVRHVSAVKATCTKAGSREYWIKGGKYYSDSYCTNETTQAAAAVKALGHSWKVSYKSLDYNTHKCSRCGITRKVSKVIISGPKLTIRKPAKAKTSITVKWKKLSAANRKKVSGIEIQYSTNKKFTDAASKVKTAKKTSASRKITSLRRKTTYYVRVRTYRLLNGKKYVSKWSAVKSVRTK
jgi:hypothetical protein